jgi:hypothetical protein
LPSRLSRMVGRAEDVRLVSARLATARFVTILGAGGVGKTTVPITVGHVATVLTSMLGLSVQSGDAGPTLIARRLSGSTIPPFPHPPSSNRTGRSPASGSRTRLHAMVRVQRPRQLLSTFRS